MGLAQQSFGAGLEHARCLKSNVTELQSHKVSWRIQPRNGRWLASAVGKTRRNASADLICSCVAPASAALSILSLGASRW